LTCIRISVRISIDKQIDVFTERDETMTLQQAMEKSEANSALYFSAIGWIIVDGRRENHFEITSEREPYKPRTCNDMESVRKGLLVSIANSEKWEPYARFEVWD
jgi:HrpA-like RNA helicase